MKPAIGTPRSWIAAVAVPVLLTACDPISLREVDEAAGPNGGFEVVRPIRGVDGAPEGLPVNWYFYAKPLLEGGARLTLDRSDPAEGLQSLHLAVEETDTVAVRRTAGLFQVFPATAGGNYRVSFRMKIAGARAIVVVRSES
ncbi:MAG TPA: hypothetical protein VK837_14875, partial [Longimicrobiales bacterium]|nr:hypothetical protein [Longimicrobiales bacterium]